MNGRKPTLLTVRPGLIAHRPATHWYWKAARAGICSRAVR